MMRRIVFRVLAFAVPLAFLIACTSQPTPEPITVVETVEVIKEVEGEPVTVIETVEVIKEVQVPADASEELPTITWMIWGGANRADEFIADFREYFPETVDQYNIRVVSPGQHDMEVYQAVRLSVAANFGVPDVVSFNYGAVPEFAQAGLLTNIGDIMAKQTDMVEAARTLSQYDGTYIGIPTEIKFKLWYYRKDLFEEAGIVPEEIETLDDFIAAGQKFREVFPDKYFINMGPQPIHYMYDGLLSPFADAVIADAEGDFQITENPIFATMMEQLKAIQDADIAYPTDDWSSDWGPAYVDSTVASWLNFQWGMLFLPSRGLPEQKGEWGVTHWPDFIRNGSDSGGSMVVFPVGGENTDLAVDFMVKAQLDPGFQQVQWEKNGVIPTLNSALEQIIVNASDHTRPEEMSDEDWNMDVINFFGPEILEMSLEAMNTTYKILPYDPAWDAERSILRSYTEAYMAGEMTLAEALAGAQADMELTIGNPWGE